jgi:hypothetical protein
LGTLFYDAANHVTALVGLFELEAAGLAEEPDVARVARVRQRLARLLASARHWLFLDTPFAREQLSPVAVSMLGRDMTDLFTERLRAKSVDLVMDLPSMPGTGGETGRGLGPVARDRAHSSYGWSSRDCPTGGGRHRGVHPLVGCRLARIGASHLTCPTGEKAPLASEPV